MHSAHFDGSFADWRRVARDLLARGIAPERVLWCEQGAAADLFAEPAEAWHAAEPSGASGRVKVPRQLLELLEQAARFRCEERWSLLYRTLWRVSQGQRCAMLAGDADGSELHRRLKAVRREAHHLHAFLRFRPCDADGGPDFVAWHEPAHDILPSASMHFAERMGRHSWLIATPRDAVYWDGRQLQHRRHCPAQWRDWAQAPDDGGQRLWLAYYGSTFNPARLNRDVMERSLPVRFWRNLPEGPLIPALMSQARAGGQRHGQAQAVGQRSGKVIRRRAQGDPSA